jgi:hypothetical protein
MTRRRRTPVLGTLAACLIVGASAGTILAAPTGEWALAIAAYDRGDHATANRIIRALAEKGDADAQYDLAVLYTSGEDFPPDYVQAWKWYQLAVSRFTPEEATMRERAAKSRDRLAAMMTSAQIAQAQRLAREWRPTTADPGLPR